MEARLEERMQETQVEAWVPEMRLVSRVEAWEEALVDPWVEARIEAWVEARLEAPGYRRCPVARVEARNKLVWMRGRGAIRGSGGGVGAAHFETRVKARVEARFEAGWRRG